MSVIEALAPGKIAEAAQTPVIAPAGAEPDSSPTTSKSEQAYGWLRRRIEGHRFGPGYRLVLGSIAKDLDMSVVPVREAIRRLEAEGLVTFERNVGARVVLVDETEYLNTMQTLGLVEGNATALAAPHLSRVDLERAEVLNRRLAEFADESDPGFDPHQFTRLNQQFHEILFEPCPNLHILDLVHRGWARMSNLRDSSFEVVPERGPESVQEHAALLELIRGGADAIDIELATREHRLRTMNAYLSARHHGTDSR